MRLARDALGDAYAECGQVKGFVGSCLNGRGMILLLRHTGYPSGFYQSGRVNRTLQYLGDLDGAAEGVE